MFNYSTTFSGFSVDSLMNAKHFYGDVLGIEIQQDMGLELKLKGGNTVFLYEKEDHVPATFTVLNFVVTDIEKAVDELASKGIQFEQYDGDLKTDEKGIFHGDGPLIAWFKDPAGNFLSVLQEK